MSTTSRTTVPTSGRVVAATIRKASSNEPIKIANPLDAAIGPAQDDDQQSRARERNRHAARNAVELADPGDGGEFGDHRAGYRHRKRQRRDPRPRAAKVVANEFAVPAAGEYAEPHRELLYHVENGDQTQQKLQEPITPACPALRCSYHVAGIGIGQHDQNAGSDARDDHPKRPGLCYRVAPVPQSCCFREEVTRARLGTGNSVSTQGRQPASSSSAAACPPSRNPRMTEFSCGSDWAMKTAA